VSSPDGPSPDQIPEPDERARAEAREVAEIIDRLSADGVGSREKASLLGRMSAVVASRAKRAGAAAVTNGRMLADLLVDAAPHIPIRDLDTLAEHHHGLTGEALAEALCRNAARTTAGIGAAGGAVAAAEWAAMPMLVAVPLEVVVETLAVASVEVKLVAELHAVYGVPVAGSGTQRAVSFTGSWASRRGIDPLAPWTIPNVMGIAGRNVLGKRLLVRFSRNLGTLIPFLIGAAVGARVNWNETTRLGESMRVDLRRVVALSGAAGEVSPDADAAP
jgi:hypothetical protein